jgi:hypothetical protein
MDFDMIIDDGTVASSQSSTQNQKAVDNPVGNNPKARPFHLTRRLSSNVPLFTSFEIKPFSDPILLSKIDALIDRFPKPPSTTEVAKPSSSKAPSSSWGLKGLAERFNIFSKN